MFIDPVTGRPRQLELTRGQQPQEPQQGAGIFGQPAAAPTGFEAAFEAERRRLMAEAPPMPETPADDGTAFGRGLRRGIPQTLSSLAAGAGALGFEDIQQYLSGIATEQEMAILRENPELLEGVDFRDIRGLNSFLSYLGELAGEQAPLIGGTLVAGGAAALAGASLPVSAVVGTAVASGPLLFGSNVQRRAEVLGINPEDLPDEDVSRAALTAIGQTALEAATNVLLVGRFGAGVARQVAENVTAESLAEVGQQALERAQAGLDLDSPDAYEEYLQAGIAGAALGGAFGGAGAVVGAGRGRADRGRQLDEDQNEEAIQNTLEAQRAEEGRQKELSEQAAAPTVDEYGAIALPAPENRISETEQNQMLKRIQREQASNFRRIRLSSLSIEERLALAKAREAARQPRRLTTTIQEIQAVLGSEVAAREAAKQKPAMAAAGQGVYTVPQSAKFNQDQIEAAIARIQATGKVNFPIVRRAIAEVTDGNVPNEVTSSVIDELVNRGLVRRIDQNGKKKYEVEPDIKPVAEQAPVARERRELDRLEQEVKQAQELRDKLAEDIRRVEQTGQTIEGRKIKPGTARNLLRQAEEQLTTLKNQAEQARQRVRGLNLQSTVPTRERVAGRANEDQVRARMEALEQDIINEKKRLSNLRRIVTRAGDRATAQQRENLAIQEAQIDRLRVQREKLNARLLNPSAAVQVKPEETAGQQARVAAGFEAEAGTAATTQAYNAAYSGVLGNLRKRLDRMGLKDVALEFDERLLKEQGADGSYANKLIKLASGIYDPDLTEQQLTDRMAAVMDHEVIHALRGMNLFSKGEWQSLSRAAAQQKYVAIKNGKATERSYSYLDRARKMYPDQSPEIQIEEAIAEMFRQHTGGTKRFTGRPGNLLQRIVNFFKSVFRANADSGFQRPSDIFERAERGEIAARRAQPEPEVEARQSRRAQFEDLFEAMGDRGALAEYTGIGRAVDQYINQSDTAQKLRSNFYAAINDPDYPAYKRNLQVNLQRTYGDRDVPVSRIEGYADPRMQKVRKNYNIPQDDVFLVANPDERELIVRLPDGSIRSARARDVADVRRIRYSNPGGEWLANKQRNAEMEMAQGGPGRFGKGLSGATTAYVADERGYVSNVTLPLSKVKRLRGANDENPRPGQYKYDELLASVQERGFSNEYPILIAVNHLGEAYITEGNNRVAIADRFSVPTIKAEVRWVNGGEEVDSNWSPESVERMALDNPFQSRRPVIPEGSSVFGTSGVALFDNPLVIEGKPTVRKIGEGMTEYHDEVYGRQLFPEDSTADYDLVLDVATEELAEQMKQPNSGAGWYSRDTQLAVDLTSQVYPKIAEPEGRSLYLTLAGIYSSGLEPEQAWLISGEAFEAWQETGVIPSTREEAARLLGRDPKMTTFRDKSGQMVTRPAGWSPRNQANVQQINMFKDLVEREGGIQNAVNWLSSLQSRQDINQVMLDAGMSTPRFKTKAEQAGPNAFGALIFGEKLGRYTIGLHGVEITADDATVDLWYTRSYRRWTGRLLEKPVGKEGIAAQPDPARGGIERQTIFRLTDDLSKRFSDMPPGDVQAMLWFFEKRLWGAQGLRTNEGTNSAGARQLLASRGIAIDERVGGPTAREPIGKEPARATGEREQRLSRRARAEQGRDAEGTGRYDTNPQIAPREVRSPDRRPAAESGLTELEPVTSEDLSNLNDDFFRRPGWAIVTATREDLDPQFKDSMNTRANNMLQEQLDYQNIPYLKVEGRYEGEDQGVSFLIIAPRATAEKIGKQAMQESILTNEGLVYTLRPLPTTPSTGSITVGDQARAQDFYSQTPDGFAFSMDLNFDIGPGKSVFPENSYERTDRPQLPIRKNDNLVEMFHWSDQELTEVDPAFAGTGPLKGAERRRGARLSFFGINPRQSQREPGTGYVKESGLGQIMHRALVDPDTLYPFNEDPAGFKDQLTTTTPDDKVSEYEQLIRDAGYAGYYMTDNGSVRSSSAPLGNVAAMFEPVPVEPAEGSRLSRRVMFSVAQQMTNEASGTSNMTAIQKQVTQYTDIADWLGKAIGLVVRRPGRAQEIADKFIQKTQDSFIPVARMIKELKDRGLTILDTIDPYLQQQLSKSRAGALIDERKRGIYKQAADAIKQLNVSENMKQSLINVSRQNATRGYGLAQIYFDRMGSDKLAMADIFLYAQHALERNAYVRQIDPANQSGSGMSDAEAQAILDWFENNLDVANRQVISRIDAAIKSIVSDTNQIRIEAGLIPEDVMNVTYNKKGVQAPQFDHYVPLRGVFDDDASADYGDTASGKRFTVRGREDQRILGRGVDQYGTDILANLLFQNTNSIIRAEQNKVALALADLMESNPEMTKEYGEILETLPQRRILNQYGQVQYTTDQRAKEENDIVVAKRNGQEIIMRMADANLAGAFNGKNVWNAGHANVVLRGMAKVNRYLSNIVTSWNPEFVISNFSRDLQNAGVNVSEFDLPGLRRDVVSNIPKALAGLKRAIRDGNFDSEWAQLYEDFARAGGQSSANPMNTLADQVEQVESLIKDFGEGGTLADLKRNGGKLLKFLEDYNTVVENAVRLTTFDALRKRGFSDARAAQAARGVTVDFTKTGDMGQFMNSMYLFYNASLQGSFFMFRAAARSKRVRRVLAGAIAMGVVSDFINSMVSGEDEAGTDEYDKIPDYILEHNWVIMLPEGLAPSGRRYIAIPMPYGLNFFYNTGRAISRAGRGGYEIDQAAKSITGTFLEVINPLGGTEHFLNFAAPTIADPFISIYGTNIDFTGRDIRREAFPGQQIARSHLYWNNTSPTAIQMSQALNSLTGGTETYGGWADISPNTLEFWFDYITGGAGRFVQRTAELPIRLSEAQSNEDILREVPLARRIFGSISSREDLGSYIRNRDRILVPRNEMRDAVDQRNRERIARLREQYSAADFRLAEQINRIENQRRQITRQMNAVRDNPNLPDERKRELLDRLDARQQQIILRGLQLMRGQD